MGLDYYNCDYCGRIFCDAGDYTSCECGAKWCSNRCAEKEGYKISTIIDEDGDEVEDYDNASCRYCRGGIEDMVEVTQSQKKILDIVMKYAEKYKDSWGIKDFVYQDDDACVDSIELFTDIIGTLPEQKDKE
jgi:hypothetical protein